MGSTEAEDFDSGGFVRNTVALFGNAVTERLRVRPALYLCFCGALPTDMLKLRTSQ